MAATRKGPASTHGPETFDELVRVLQERMPTAPPSHRAIGERVLTDPEGTAFMTISELAATLGVNESTVVRFATSMGLSGYPALTKLCQQRLRDQAQMLRRLEDYQDLASASGDADTRGHAAAYDQANIARTFARIDDDTWQAVVAGISGSANVYVLGLRKCFAPAYLLGYLLRLVRDDVHTLTQGSGTLADELRQIAAGDTFVAVSIHRYSADTVRAFRYASDAGATTVALTDNPTSPLCEHADHVVYVDTTGSSFLRSVTAFTSLVQALAGDVAVRCGTDSRNALRTEEELLERFDAYLAGGPRKARNRSE